MLVAGSEGEEFEDISTQVNTKNNLDIFEGPFSLKKFKNSKVRSAQYLVEISTFRNKQGFSRTPLGTLGT